MDFNFAQNGQLNIFEFLKKNIDINEFDLINLLKENPDIILYDSRIRLAKEIENKMLF